MLFGHWAAAGERFFNSAERIFPQFNMMQVLHNMRSFQAGCLLLTTRYVSNFPAALLSHMENTIAGSKSSVW